MGVGGLNIKEHKGPFGDEEMLQILIAVSGILVSDHWVHTRTCRDASDCTFTTGVF